MDEYMIHLYAAAYDRQVLDMAEEYCAPGELPPPKPITAQDRLEELELDYFAQFAGTELDEFIPF